MMATSQGLPSRDLVVRSGEVPESFAHLFDDQHTPQRKLIDDRRPWRRGNMRGKGRDRSDIGVVLQARPVAGDACKTNRTQGFETFEVKPVPRA
jgi:hypothetical protein